MYHIRLFLLSLAIFLQIGCSSDKNNTSSSEEIIAPQPLTYHDDANITLLSAGYGAFGKYSVKTKSIENNRYNYKPEYQKLNLKTVLYHPVGIDTPRPTLFFYGGYRSQTPDRYKGLLYFVASKGYNIIFLTCPKAELRNLKLVTQDAIDAFASYIDKTKVGFIGHSMGAGVTFWMIKEFESQLGSKARLLFPMASGYTAFNTDLIPTEKDIQLPSNTKMIQQIYAKDFTTDIRIGIDLFLNNTILIENKEFMFIYGDQNHTADHSSMAHDEQYDAFMQRSIYRPLDALMDEVFNNNPSARKQLKEQLDKDAFFHPYIGKTPQKDIKEYILPEKEYHYNCSEGGNVQSKRKEYCKALGL